MDEEKYPEITSISDRMKFRLERLKMFSDYTRFHIGLYTGVAAAIIATANVGKQLWFLIALVPLAFAGFCGGVVAGNVMDYQSLWHFRNAEIGPKIWSDKPLFSIKATRFERCEHLAFWGALIVYAVVLVVAPKDLFSDT
ncbi:hypothetical protein ACN28E_38925 [Archangium lansingense]|uniref:hypothetical protein n=1 Tax=Archangium lansingense TaxID=2995310 RepID=UPI003B7E8201